LADGIKSNRKRGRELEVPPPTDQLLEYLAEYNLRVGELALSLREIILTEAPDATEKVFKSYVVSTNYSFTERWMDGFCYIAVYPRHVNLGFARGAELDDPEGLLLGSGKIMRHLKVAQPDDLKSPYLRSFIRAAIKHSKSDLAERLPRPSPRSSSKTTRKKRRQ